MTMRYLGALALLTVGFGAGWAFRDAQTVEAPVRSERQDAARETRPAADNAPDALPPGYAAKEQDPVLPPAEGEESAEVPAETVAASPEQPADPEAEKVAKLMRSMLPLMKMQSAREGHEAARELAELLGLDERREKQLADAIAKDRVRKLEDGVIPMLEGKEPDETMLAAMTETDGLSKALQNDLSLILNSNELDTVRTHYREKHEEAQRKAIEAEVEGLAIPDLTPDQERELRALLKSEHDERVSVKAGVSTGSGGGVRMKMKSSVSKDGMVEALDEEYGKRREKLARFLSTEQLAHLDKQHEEERKEAEAAAGIMGGMFGAFLGGKPEKQD